MVIQEPGFSQDVDAVEPAFVGLSQLELVHVLVDVQLELSEVLLFVDLLLPEIDDELHLSIVHVPTACFQDHHFALASFNELRERMDGGLLNGNVSYRLCKRYFSAFFAPIAEELVHSVLVV
jgi:hypothetical protein